LIVINRKMQLPGKCEENAENLCRDTLGNAPKSSWIPFEQYLKGIGDSLGNAQRVLETFSAMLSE
jgi:hypothetical protein